MKQLYMFTTMLLFFSLGFSGCGTDDPPVRPETEQPEVPNTPDPGGNGKPDDNDMPENGGNGQIPGDNGNSNPGNEGNDNENNKPENMSNKLRITVGSVLFTATLEDHAAAKAFRALLPMTVSMSELNGNEKYFYLPESLPTAASNPRSIRTGDLMLYGSSCLVLFYESFPTSYSYTRLGRVDDASGLASALGGGSVTVRFEVQ